MNTHRIASFEWGRVAALFAVITLHSQAFMTAPQFDEQPWVGMILNQFCRFAVPLFFIMAGYFIMPKLQRAPWKTFRQYASPLMKLWLVWSALYLLFPFNFGTVIEQGYLAERMPYWSYLASSSLNTLFEGGLVHLWYIPGLLCGLAVMAQLCYMKQQKWLLPIGLTFYAYGLSAGSYEPIFMTEAPIFTRNGPFFSTLLLTVGYTFRHHNIHASRPVAIMLAVVGMMMHFAEAFFLTRYDMRFVEHDYLIGTPFWAAGIFLFLAGYASLGASSKITWLSQRTLGVYLCHLMVLITLMNLLPLLGLNIYIKDILLILLGISASYGFVVLIERSPLSTWLLRQPQGTNTARMTPQENTQQEA
ncbi:acyltransferase [Photobacterium aphoticum]|uniref:acyltransferase n=1 Tax=Photobacterium aphoticum TaxID=754436 RepID=UPI0009E41991|nr:acyltransferase family protein [Photobacterium aphoticum]PSU58915.1 fucose 4-O-acetylase [Photobacterium aphoticum]GHA57977.1 fucose 4-O-acetylase [Photobacterium aphoticum]